MKVALRASIVLFFLFLVTHREVLHQLTADIGGHDHDGIFEIYRSAVTVGQPAIVKNLQEDIEDVRMGFFDLVEQEDRIGPPPDGLGQVSALVVSHISGRSADQSGDGVFFHEFGHVDPDHGLFVVEHEFGQGPGEFRLADAGGSQEDKGTDRPVWVLQSGTGPSQGARNSGNALILPDDPLFLSRSSIWMSF